VRPLLAVAAASCMTSLARPARAVDPFEIQVYDGTANPQGVPGLELHLNDVARGLTTGNGTELPLNHQAHITLEPSYGLFPFWELGGYFETAVRPDGTLDYAGVKLRSKFVTTKGFSERFRLGINLELSLLPDTYDQNRWGTELRPIAAYEDSNWEFVVNPILDTPLAGPGFSGGPTFEPAFEVLRKVDGQISFGIEYYSALGAIGHGLLPWSKTEEYLYEVVNLLAIERFEFNAGIGEGLTGASNDYTFKMILGYELERRAASPRTLSMRPAPFLLR
jgi:hypothetical protein